MLFKHKENNKEIVTITNNNEKIAVIDTETNWDDEVMSIGIVVASANDYSVIDKKYYILSPEYKVGGMYSYVIDIENNRNKVYKRNHAINEIILWLNSYNVKKLFAYNASFDFRHLSELWCFNWYDIMNIAANRRYNKKIPANLECFKNGKLKRGYNVEAMYKMLSGQCKYNEVHNALKDVEDELQILKMLNLDLSVYEKNSIIHIAN